MKRALVNGMSGTGKSTLLSELAIRGYRTVDTDHPDAGGDYFDTTDGELWIEHRIGALLSIEDPSGVLFIQGRTAATLELVTTIPVGAVVDAVLAHGACAR